MDLDDTGVQWAYYCIAEMMRHRRRAGVSIPDPIRRLFDRLDREVGADPSEREQGRPVIVEEIGTEEAARILRCTDRQVRRLAADLEGVRVGRIWVFDRGTVEEYANLRDIA